MIRQDSRRWVELEIHLLSEYELYWEKRTKARWLLAFNGHLCMWLITWYSLNLPEKPPVFNPWYVRLCHRYYRWRKI